MTSEISRGRAFTTDSLSPALADRLVKLLGMTDSAHDGEALNAMRHANRVLRENKATWEQALQPPPPSQPEPGMLLVGWPTHWRAAVRFCNCNASQLNEKSAAFVRQLISYQARPSPAQLDWLRNCVVRIARQAAAP